MFYSFFFIWIQLCNFSIAIPHEPFKLLILYFFSLEIFAYTLVNTGCNSTCFHHSILSIIAGFCSACQNESEYKNEIPKKGGIHKEKQGKIVETFHKTWMVYLIFSFACENGFIVHRRTRRKIEMYNAMRKSKSVHFVKDKDKIQWPKRFSALQTIAKFNSHFLCGYNDDEWRREINFKWL